MSIRPAAAADLPAVLGLNEAAVPAMNSVDLDFMHWCLDVAPWFGVAKADGKVAGFCIILGPGLAYHSQNYAWFSARYDDFAYIDRIAVCPTAQGKGVGKALYTAAFQDLSGSTPRIACEVNLRPRNEISLNFHRALGFQVIGQQDTCGGEKTVAMHVRQL